MVRRVDADELDPEAPEGVERDVEGEEPWRPRMESPLDQVHEQCRGEEVPQRLVEESRVVGELIERGERSVRSVDLEAPGEVGGLAVQLLVPPVADSADGLGDEEAGRETVGEEWNIRPGPLRDHSADDHPRGYPAPDTEASLPDRKRPPPLVRHLVPARRDVVQPRADDAGTDAPDGAAEDQIPVAATVDPARARDPDCDTDRGEERQAVHVDRQRPEVDGAVARARGSRRGGSRCRHSPFGPGRLSRRSE